MHTFLTASGTRMVTTSLVGRGGEGYVFNLQGLPASVAKVLLPQYRSRMRERKMQLMLGSPPLDPTRSLQPPHNSISWPKDLLYENRSFAGFVMPKASAMHPVFSVYNPKARARAFPHIDWRFNHRVAYNLALVVHALHTQGYVIGDINQKNILVASNALVTLIDVDSIQVSGQSGQVFPCEVGVPEFTAPELMNRLANTDRRKPCQDNFGLAVLIFMLLMEGFHPFMGASRGRQGPDGENGILECIKDGVFPYLDTAHYNPPVFAPDMAMLHPQLQALFSRAFVDGYRSPERRPSAMEWALAVSAAEKDLVCCPRDKSHWYSRHWGKI